MPYNMTDEIIKRQRAKREKERKQILLEVKAILDELAPKYEFSKAYIFGSLVKRGRFRSDSDVDIAIFGLKDEYFFKMIGEVFTRLGRDVDICQMETVDDRIRKNIKREGVLWKREE